MRRLLKTMIVFAFLLMLVLSGCSQSTDGKGPIIIGSKIDTEGALLAQMIIALLEDNGFDVVDKSEFGPTNIVRSAILSGEVDIYPEYTGNGAFFFDLTDLELWNDAAAGYEKVKQLDMETNDIVWLQSAPANNTWAIAIPRELAEQENIQTLEDFAAYVNQDGYVKLAGSEEFVSSSVALPAFFEAYDFNLSQNQLLVFAGGNTAQTEKAAADGTDGVNAAMAYGTDGNLSALDLIVLEDPKGAQPVYEPAPIVRGVIFDQYPELADILNPVFATLDLATLQTLNARIALEGDTAATVARDYLESKGFLE
jgi:osmoprotectant transport system substrate-binding protein